VNLFPENIQQLAYGSRIVLVCIFSSFLSEH
jgi:hypothetical protein